MSEKVLVSEATHASVNLARKRGTARGGRAGHTPRMSESPRIYPTTFQPSLRICTYLILFNASSPLARETRVKNIIER